MTRLPALKGSDVVRALRKAGFTVVRIKGSHHILEHNTDPRRRTTVPMHKGKDLPRGLIQGILSDVKLTADEFAALLWLAAFTAPSANTASTQPRRPRTPSHRRRTPRRAAAR